MSVLLMAQVKAFVREKFSAQDVVSVDYYGGEFSGDEVAVSGFKAPAILIAGLGWTRPRGTERLLGKGTRVCHMAAFVVTNLNSRSDRMLEAQRLAEMLDLLLVTWTPTNEAGAAVEVAAPEEDIRCENIYNKKLDKVGMGVWLVTWRQCIRPRVALPQMFDLLGIDIVSTNRLPFSREQDGSDEHLQVTHEINFLPPA